MSLRNSYFRRAPWLQFESLLALTLFAFGVWAFLANYRPPLVGYFMREDSRYFANGLFSFYDLWWDFTTPYNTMGHYRPITKLIWGVPEWLGFQGPLVYYVAGQLCLALATLFLMRLFYLLFGNVILAVLCGVLFSLMPVNAKPLYWISAGQDSTALLFVLAAIVLRWEQWRQPSRSQIFRWLALVSLFFAVTSREAGFVAGPMMLLVDYRFAPGRLAAKARATLDISLIFGTGFTFVYILNPPFHLAKPGLSKEHILSFAPFENLWAYALTTPWALGDAGSVDYPLFAKVASGIALALVVVGPLLHRSLFFAAVLAAGGVGPFLLIDGFGMEYVYLYGAGISLLVIGSVALLLKNRQRWWWQTALWAMGLALVGGYYLYLAPCRDSFRDNYTDRSLLMRDFLGELKAYVATLPAHRVIVLNDLGPYTESRARDTHHFIPSSMPQLIPERVILFPPEAMKTGEGSGLLEPEANLWKRDYAKLPKPISIRYTDKGFVRD